MSRRVLMADRRCLSDPQRERIKQSSRELLAELLMNIAVSLAALSGPRQPG